MNKEKAQEILKGHIQPNDGSHFLSHYPWRPGEKEITLEDQFNVEEQQRPITGCSPDNKPTLLRQQAKLPIF